jgi:hypothetical protein
MWSRVYRAMLPEWDPLSCCQKISLSLFLSLPVVTMVRLARPPHNNQNMNVAMTTPSNACTSTNQCEKC